MGTADDRVEVGRADALGRDATSGGGLRVDADTIQAIIEEAIDELEWEGPERWRPLIERLRTILPDANETDPARSR